MKEAMDKPGQNDDTCAESAPETWLEFCMRFTPASIALAVLLTTVSSAGSARSIGSFVGRIGGSSLLLLGMYESSSRSRRMQESSSGSVK